MGLARPIARGRCSDRLKMSNVNGVTWERNSNRTGNGNESMVLSAFGFWITGSPVCGMSTNPRRPDLS